MIILPYKKQALFILLLIIFIGCNGNKEISYWESQKENFRYQNKKDFIIDSLVEVEINSCLPIKHISLDSIFPGEAVYLYSWQNSDSLKNEFTLIKDRGELGLKIFYVIMTKNDKLLSVTDMASSNREVYDLFETKSKLHSKDTILQVRKVTRWLDPETQKRFDLPKSDSSVLIYIIGSNGKVTEEHIKKTQ